MFILLLHKQDDSLINNYKLLQMFVNMKSPSAFSKQIICQIACSHAIRKAESYQDQIRTDECFSENKKSPEKFKGISSLKVLSDSSHSELKQLRLPSISGSERQIFQLEKQNNRKLIKAKSCQAFFYHPPVQQVKTERNNFKRLNFVLKNQRQLQNQSDTVVQRKSPEKEIKPHIRIINEAFRKKQEKAHFFNHVCGEPSIKKFIDSPCSFRKHDSLKDAKEMCFNCKNQKLFNARIKQCLLNIHKMVEEFKKQCECIREYLMEAGKNFTQNFKNFYSIKNQPAQDLQDSNIIFMPQRLKVFVEELSQDISELFQKELKKMESRRRSDIGKIIKNIVPKFERDDFIEKNIQVTPIKKKPGAFKEILSLEQITKEEEQIFANSLKNQIQHAVQDILQQQDKGETISLL